MGIPYFTTLIYQYLFSNNGPTRQVNLTNENVIIDGYSLFYFIYYMIKKEDNNKPINEQITTKKYSYEGLSKRFEEILKEFKTKCAKLMVVFDGISQSNKYRRRDPKRDSTVQFNNGRSRLPRLLHDELIHILHQLNINVHVTPDEADPIIVQMAQKHNAFIVARDSDYFLYNTTKGYVPLDKMELKTLQGTYYRMNDVFKDILQEGIALWATTITYDVIHLDVLQKEFQVEKAFDSEEFSRWIESSNSDGEKSQRLSCQYHLLRFIQQFGYKKTLNKMIPLLHQNRQQIFEELFTNFTNTSPRTPKLTPNGNEIHPYLNQLFINGKLDSDVINILLRRQILYLWEGNHQIHLDLMSPMCQILIQWDCSKSNDGNHPPRVTFNNEHYNPLEFVPSGDLLSLDQLIISNGKKRKGFLLSCVDFALRSKQRINFDSIDHDYKLCFSLFELWWNTKTEHSHLSKMTLLALIISFLKHALLDTRGETKERSTRNEQFPDKPYRQYSHQLLKSYFPSEECFHLRGNLMRYSTTLVTDDQIEQELKECQQFYKELSMINQFCQEPFAIHPPNFYFSDLTYPLAIRLNQSKHFWKDIKSFCSDNQIFFGFIEEVYQFFLNNSSSITE